MIECRQAQHLIDSSEELANSCVPSGCPLLIQEEDISLSGGNVVYSRSATDRNYEYGWNCDGEAVYGACVSNNAESKERIRFRCKECDFDLRGQCLKEHMYIVVSQGTYKQSQENEYLLVMIKQVVYNSQYFALFLKNK